MSADIPIKLPNGGDKEVPKTVTALDVAKEISPRLAKILQAFQLRQAGFSGKKMIRRAE